MRVQLDSFKLIYCFLTVPLVHLFYWVHISKQKHAFISVSLFWMSDSLRKQGKLRQSHADFLADHADCIACGLHYSLGLEPCVLGVLDVGNYVSILCDGTFYLASPDALL